MFPAPAYGSLIRRGETLFAVKNEPPKQQPFLVVLKAPEEPASERVLVDPNLLDPKGGTAIDFFVPSLDGRLTAVSLSEGGSEAGDLHVYDTASGRKLPDVIPRVNGGTAGGDVAWNADGSGFFYTRYPRGEERRHGPGLLSAESTFPPGTSRADVYARRGSISPHRGNPLESCRTAASSGHGQERDGRGQLILARPRRNAESRLARRRGRHRRKVWLHGSIYIL